MSPAVVAQRLKLAGHIVNEGSLAAGPVQQCLYLQPGASHSPHCGALCCCYCCVVHNYGSSLACSFGCCVRALCAVRRQV